MVYFCTKKIERARKGAGTRIAESKMSSKMKNIQSSNISPKAFIKDHYTKVTQQIKHEK